MVIRSASKVVLLFVLRFAALLALTIAVLASISLAGPPRSESVEVPAPVEDRGVATSLAAAHQARAEIS